MIAITENLWFLCSDLWLMLQWACWYSIQIYDEDYFITDYGIQIYD